VNKFFKKGKMKAIILIVAAILACCSASAQTTNITFTNKTGEVFTNAPVMSFTATTVYYETPSGGGGVKLSDLPPALQKLFNYDPAKAAAERAAKAERTRALAVRQAAEREAISQASAAKAWREKVGKTKVAIYGKIIQRLDIGLLVDGGSEERGVTYSSWSTKASTGYGTSQHIAFSRPDGTPGAWGICLLIGPARGIDGEMVNTNAYPDGTYTYKTITGAQKTIRRYNMDPAAVQTIASPEELDSIINRVPE
jgi:hypothetical protein